MKQINKKKVRMLSIWEDMPISGRPREDFMAYDAQRQIYVVADGVGLWEGIEYIGKYPKSSGSGRLSRVFCQAFVKHFQQHQRSNVIDAFRAANAAAGTVNRDRSKFDVFRKHRGLYAATAAIARIKGRTLEWAHICDAGVAVIGKNSDIRLMEDGCRHHFPWPRDVRGYESSTWTLFARTLVRNAISKDGSLLGYGVITGEPEAERYLETGKYNLKDGDVVVVFTDGFSPYLRLPKFRKLIASRISERRLREGVRHIIESRVAPIREKLKSHSINGRASVEIIQGKLKKVLGKQLTKFEFAKEKTIVIVQV